MTIVRRFEWDMGHRLPSHSGKCRRLHGHRYVLEVQVNGPVLNSTGPHSMRNPSDGMVVDFFELDSVVRNRVVSQLDHYCMLSIHDPLFDAIRDGEGVRGETFGVIGVDFVPTAENIVRDIYIRLAADPLFTSGRLRIDKLRLWETPKSFVEWEE